MSSGSYRDLHEHLDLLDDAGLLVRVHREIDKDTEMHPLVRWQFRGGIREVDRKAFLFDNVIDGTGHRFDIPVAVGVLATNREIYRIGMGCALDEIADVWTRAMAHPIAPEVLKTGLCQEIVVEGAALSVPWGALDGIPVPISTPGWDNAPYTTTSHFVTADPETGIQNMGNYRGQVKGPLRLGMNPSLELRPGIYKHWEKARRLGVPLPCAVVLGCPPVITFASVQKVPETTDEIAVAGGLAGCPIRVVRARTVDLLVPAEAEVVVEGLLRTDVLEPEGPVGESHGHVNLQEYNAILEVTAVTRRRDAILTSIISQVTPSESSLIKRVAYEPMILSHLRSVGCRGVVRVGMHEPLTNLRKVVLVQMEKGVSRNEIWRALYAASSYQQAIGKWVIAVDEDIDPDNADAILWALSYRMRPHEDLVVLPHKDPGHGPRVAGEDSAVLVDATLKAPFPPVSLPKRPYMERAKVIWDELGLQRLTPEPPWFGYSLGEWPESLEEEAQLAVDGRYFEVGERAQQHQRSDVTMNQEVPQPAPEPLPDTSSALPPGPAGGKQGS